MIARPILHKQAPTRPKVNPRWGLSELRERRCVPFPSLRASSSPDQSGRCSAGHTCRRRICFPGKRVASETNHAVRVCRIWCGLPNISALDVVVVISHDQRGRTPSDFEIVHHGSSAFRVPRTCVTSVADGDFRAQVAS